MSAKGTGDGATPSSSTTGTPPPSQRRRMSSRVEATVSSAMAAVVRSRSSRHQASSRSRSRSRERHRSPRQTTNAAAAAAAARRQRIIDEMYQNGADIGPEKFASKVFVRSRSGHESLVKPNVELVPTTTTAASCSSAESDPDAEGDVDVDEDHLSSSTSSPTRRTRDHTTSAHGPSQGKRYRGFTQALKRSLSKESSTKSVKETSGYRTNEDASDDSVDVPAPSQSRRRRSASRARSRDRRRQVRGGGQSEDVDKDVDDGAGTGNETREDTDNDVSRGDETRRTHGTPRTHARKMERTETGNGTEEMKKARPVRIRYQQATRGVGGGKREISHASLGKLVARLTDAHQYDTEFRDVFLLTYRCFCSPYDFIKKLMKRHTAVLTLCGGLDAETLKETQYLLDQIALEEENERSSTCTSISTARSDINTSMEASVSIMRVLSVLKFWIKESGFIEMDLQQDRRAQKKLMAFLADIQSTSPVASIRQHAENMLLTVAQIVRQHQASVAASPPSSQTATPAAAVATSSRISSDQRSDASTVFSPMSPPLAPSPSSKVPPPPPLSASSSVSSVNDTQGGGESASPARAERSSALTPTKERLFSTAMSKLKLTRSSSDPKRERSFIRLKAKSNTSDGAQFRNRATDDGSFFKRSTSSGVSAPHIKRGVTTGSCDTDGHRGGSSGLEDVIQDTIQRARLSQRGSRMSYENAEPLTGISAQELADQLTLIEAESFFSKINPRELTNKAWTRENKHKEAPHVMALIELFDATAEWVSSEILHPQLQAVERAKIIMLYIDAADNCYQMNNFNTMFEIVTGLTAPCIRQLSTTWGLVHAHALEKYQCLQQVCSPEDNYRNYRQAFALAEGQPRLPCWFILMKDLFTFEEAMKSIEDGLVNWQKFRKIYKVINEALDRQNMNYLPADGSCSTGISRKGKGALRLDRKVQVYIRHRVDTIRKDSSVLYQLARNANTQESILFVNSLSEAGFL